MKKSLLILSILSYSLAQGQELSLKEALSRANSEAVRQSATDYDLQQLETRIQKSKRLPLIYGDGNLQRNLIIPVTPVPAIAFDPNASADAIMPLRFATDWSAKAGLQFSMDIFNPQQKSAVNDAQFNVIKSSIAKEKEQYNQDEAVTKAYAAVVLAEKQAQAAKEMLDNYTITYDVIKKRHEAGRVSTIEYNNAQKKYLELQQLYSEASYVLANNKLALTQYLDIAPNYTFSTSIDEMIAMYDNNVQANFTLRELEATLDYNNDKIKKINWQALPKLTLNAYYGAQYFDNQLSIFNGDQWYGNSFVNLSVRLPITETYERSLSRKKLQLNATLTESQLRNEKVQNDIKIQQKENDILSLKSKLNQLKQSLALVESNVNISKATLDEGTILISDYNKEIENLLDAQKKIWQTQYDLLSKELE